MTWFQRTRKRIAPLLGALVLLTGGVGCGKTVAEPEATSDVRTVAVVSPTWTSLYWTIQQPASIEAFEETPILPKIAGYVESWNVDIGDHVRKGQLLAELWVPEVVAGLRQKEAAVVQAEAQIVQAREVLRTAEATVVRAEANRKLAEASRLRADADKARWQSQYERERKLLSEQATSTKQVEIATNQLRAAEASQGETSAAVEAARATVAESKAQRDKAAADVRVAEANLQAARADRDQSAALRNYARIEAPFDGVVSQRHVSRGDFVQPPTTGSREPLYVIQRRDLMRIFIEVPEAEAVWVKEGDPVQVRIPVLNNQQFNGTVRRMAYALRRRSRTLLTEVDLPNPDDLLRPGTYAQASIQVKRDHVLTLPASAVATEGDVNEGYQSYCFVLEKGKVRRVLVEVGSRASGQVEVLQKKVQDNWEDFTGEEQVVRGDLSSLSDGLEVRRDE